MRWDGNGDYAIKSGEYIVTKNHTLAGWLYAARIKGQPTYEPLGNHATAAEAKAACVAMATTLGYPRAKA